MELKVPNRAKFEFFREYRTIGSRVLGLWETPVVKIMSGYKLDTVPRYALIKLITDSRR